VPSALASLALLAAMASAGMQSLRRARAGLSPLEIVAYGAPLGIVVSSLVILVLACAFGLSAGLVAAVGAGALAGAWVLAARGEPRQDERRPGRVLTPIALLVLGMLALRWAVLWSGALTRGSSGLTVGFTNLFGDWAQHLGDTTSFAFGRNFPPTHPRLPGLPFSYHYLTSITAAAMVVLGLDPIRALPLQSFVLSVLVLLGVFAFARRLTGSSDVAALAACLFFLGGGFGWWLPLAQVFREPGGLAAFLHHPWSQTVQEAANFRWQNVYFALIGPQRSCLYGFPLGLLSLTLLLEGIARKALGVFVGAGIVAGLLPFAHLGTFLSLVLIVPAVALLFPSRGWIAFGAVWVAVATPQILLQQGGGTGALHAMRWQVGWIAPPDSWGWFWLKNLGAFLPALGLALLDRDLLAPQVRRFLAGFMPVFVLANLVSFQPWDWDNTKVLVWWYLASCVLVAAVLAKLWREVPHWPARATIGVVLATMLGAGVLQNVDQLMGNDRHPLLTAEEVALAERVRKETEPRAIFAVGIQSNHPVPVLAGRRVMMSYPGWLWSQGFDYAERERDLRAILALAPDATERMARYHVDYVVIGPTEKETLGADLAAYRARYPVVIESESYAIFDVRAPRPR